MNIAQQQNTTSSFSHDQSDPVIRWIPLIPLLGGHKSGHDWYNILSRWEALASAQSIADTCFFLGVIVCVAAIIAGIGMAVHRFLHPPLVLEKMLE